MGARCRLLLAVTGLLFLTFLESLEGALLGRKQQFRQGLIAQRCEDKKDDESGNHDRHNVEESPQLFPAGASGIIKNGLSHLGDALLSYAVSRTRSIR